MKTADTIDRSGRSHENTTVAGSAAWSRLRSVKIQPDQLNKLAIVYVRQSSPQQVMEHRESRERQYALAD